jgi:glycosyltransferase involved in cell wall biosynthesis
MTRTGPVRARLFMERHLGHQTYYLNLRRFLEGRVDLRTSWTPVDYAPRARWWDLIRLPRTLRESLRGRQEVLEGLAAGDDDVFFFNTQVPAALGGRRVRTRPYVVATDLTPLQYDRMGRFYGHAPDEPGPWRSYKHQVNARLFQEADRLLPWSTWAARSLVEDYHVDPARVEVLAPGVDLDLWRPAEPAPQQAPARILFVGGDLRRKGGTALLEAFQELSAGCAELVLVTRTPLEAPPSGVLVRSDLQPNSAELIGLYRSCDLFVLPSDAEAFGIAAAEAAAAGLPLVVTDSGGLGDTVEDGVNGLLVPPSDSRALASALRRLIAEPALRRAMGRASRTRAERLFDARRNADRVAEVLKQACRRAAFQEPEAGSAYSA